LDIKVSIIIPVYNAEKYLEECITSLLNQTLQECEFIFINDGSVDESKHLIESYQELDSRLILINQENEGVSAARNRGLQRAVGEYIGFVDADDYIEKDMFGVLYDSAKQHECDLVISNFEGETEGQKVNMTYPFEANVLLDKEYIKRELLPYFIKSDNLNAVWTKIFKTKVIKEYNVTFPEKVALGEDGMFNLLFLSYASTAKYINFTGYHYREVVGSATRNIVEKDYFNRAIEVYNLELPVTIVRQIDKGEIQQLKSIKLIKSVMGYIHLYFTPAENFGLLQRFTYIRNMIRNQCVQGSLPIFYREHYSSLGRYEKFVLAMINQKSTVGLYLATTYSRIRNR
jgi:glycosyltransferase involved in cell wall biosynthesis